MAWDMRRSRRDLAALCAQGASAARRAARRRAWLHGAAADALVAAGRTGRSPRGEVIGQRGARCSTRRADQNRNRGFDSVVSVSRRVCRSTPQVDEEMFICTADEVLVLENDSCESCLGSGKRGVLGVNRGSTPCDSPYGVKHRKPFEIEKVHALLFSVKWSTPPSWV